MIFKRKILKWHLKMPSLIARRSDHGYLVRNGTRSTDVVDVVQSDGARNRTPVNLQTNLSLEVVNVVGGVGEVEEVEEVEEIGEAEARVVEQKDWASRADWLVEGNDVRLGKQRTHRSTQYIQKYRIVARLQSASGTRKNCSGPFAIVHYSQRKEITKGLSKALHYQLITV